MQASAPSFADICLPVLGIAVILTGIVGGPAQVSAREYSLSLNAGRPAISVQHIIENNNTVSMS